MMYQYQETERYFAQVAPDMQTFVVDELQEAGVEDIKPVYLGVYFKATQKQLYILNYTSRMIIRILAPLIEFPCKDPDELYEQVKKIEWKDFLSLDNTLAVFATLANSDMKHTQYASRRVKDAVVDWFREKFGRRPNVDPKNPDLWLNVHIENNKALLSVDTSGGSLHRRGYRKQQGYAPMQETLAAAIVKMSGWDGSTPLYDPMCGSGTLLFEAMMKYCNIPSAYLREHFGFYQLPDFNRSVWDKVRKDANNHMKKLPYGLISGSDISPKAIQVARDNAKNLPYSQSIRLEVKDFNQIHSLKNTTIITNPPYGIRLGETEEVKILFKQFGDFLKQKCTDSNAFIYFGEREFLKEIHLRSTWKKTLANAGLDGRLAKFELYEGSEK
ncbi:MAG TPA: THUMP domain-containing protein [Planctomycetota bacterium]|nr:THUMP domain-containing protein [Planctomycetota bacterium]